MILGVTIAVVLILGSEIWTTENTPIIVSEQPLARMTDIPLMDSTPQPTSLGAGLGQWQFLYFGYRSCPDICPTTLAYLSKETKLLTPDIHPFRVVFISVDPRRDPPQAADEYAKSFHPDFMGLTGKEEDLRALTKLVGGSFGYEDKLSKAGYLVNHPAAIFVVDPRGQLIKTISPPFESGAVAKFMTKISRGR